MNVAYQYCALILVSVLIGSIIGQCDKFKCYRNEIGGKGYLKCKDKDIRDLENQLDCSLSNGNILGLIANSRANLSFSIGHGALSVVQKYFNKFKGLFLYMPFEYIKSDTFKVFEASKTLKMVALSLPSKYLDPRIVLNIFDGPGQYTLVLHPYLGQPMLKLVNLYFKSPNTTVMLRNAGTNITCGNNSVINESYEGNGYHVIFYPAAINVTFEFRINRCSLIRFRRKSVGKATTKARNEATTKAGNKANQLFYNIPLTIVFVLLLALMNQF